jgi:lysophospholipase L1-like esterase
VPVLLAAGVFAVVGDLATPERLGQRARLEDVLRAAVLTSVLAVVLSGCVDAQPAPPPTPDDPPGVAAGRFQEYVALGDSFTAGPLVPPEDPNGRACGRSLANYPHLLADRLEVEELRDVSCVGADTADLAHRQSGVFGSNPPQLRALRAGTDLVTVGIGGNDEDLFARLVVGCARARATDPRGAPCRDDPATQAIAGRTAVTADRVAGVLRRIRARSPQAEVLLVGYPRITPATGTCPGVLPFADGDYRFAAGVEKRLNDALRSAAASAGVTFVDVAAASRGHDACAGEHAWVNGRRTVAGEALSYHPFGSGMAAVAELILDYLA